MVGDTIGHYRVLSKIGEGGMGSVYRAHDEVLKRDVAVKFLAKDIADKVGPDRLLEEARIASSLSHPNICCYLIVRAALPPTIEACDPK
jgi:serine/threonine protein kinase